MNLSEAMFSALEEARQRAIRESESTPMGIQPMSQVQGQQALDVIRHRPPRSRPRYNLRPMGTDIGQIIDGFIRGVKPRQKSPIERYMER